MVAPAGALVTPSTPSPASPSTDAGPRSLAEWHAGPVGELSLTRQAVYAAALTQDFPASVRIRPWLTIIGGSERLWRVFVRGASEPELAWAQAALVEMDAFAPLLDARHVGGEDR